MFLARNKQGIHRYTHLGPSVTPIHEREGNKSSMANDKNAISFIISTSFNSSPP